MKGWKKRRQRRIEDKRTRIYIETEEVEEEKKRENEGIKRNGRKLMTEITPGIDQVPDGKKTDHQTRDSSQSFKQ